MRRLLVLVAGVIVVVAGATLAAGSVYHVEPTEVAVFIRDGEVIRIQQPGVRIRAPFSDYVVVEPYAVSGFQLDSVAATTSDGRPCIFQDLTVTYRLGSPNIAALRHEGESPLRRSPLFETMYPNWLIERVASQDPVGMRVEDPKQSGVSEIARRAAELGVQIHDQSVSELTPSCPSGLVTVAPRTAE